jgi:hypothetical protein
VTWNVDADQRNADWIRFRWPFPAYKSKAFNRELEAQGITLAQFKRMPVYAEAVARGLIKKDEWVGRGKA